MNELSLTAGRAFVSTQTIVNDPFQNDFDPHIHFGREEMVEVNYGRFLISHKIFGFYAELPVAI